METDYVPKHIGIIMDGNRRFSKRLMMKPWKGHEWGAEKVKKVLEWCKDYGIEELTLYSFSYQNFNRSKKEFDHLMDIFIKNFRELKNKSDKLAENGIRINVIGRTWLFPEELQKEIKDIMELTKENSEYTINFAMAYGGQEEIVDATKKIAERVKEGNLNIDDINKEIFSESLYMKNEPDVIIRTGGEKRSSNFLPFQSAYSEWFYIEKMWPEFEKEDFAEIIDTFSIRKRRFGK
ncbi:MAG: polyprenyl diphosphate synthase [Nanoarchaeota archaeon]